MTVAESCSAVGILGPREHVVCNHQGLYFSRYVCMRTSVLKRCQAGVFLWHRAGRCLISHHPAPSACLFRRVSSALAVHNTSWSVVELRCGHTCIKTRELPSQPHNKAHSISVGSGFRRKPSTCHSVVAGTSQPGETTSPNGYPCAMTLVVRLTNISLQTNDTHTAILPASHGPDDQLYNIHRIQIEILSQCI
jgi:hypothetical protein